MPTIDDLKAMGVDPNDAKALKGLREKWITENKEIFQKLIFISHYLGDLNEIRKRSWYVVDRPDCPKIQLFESPTYHKPGTDKEWLWDRILVVSEGKPDISAKIPGSRQFILCWMNLSDHDNHTPDSQFHKSNNVFVPGKWLEKVHLLAVEAAQIKAEHEAEANDWEAEVLRAKLLIGENI